MYLVGVEIVIDDFGIGYSVFIYFECFTFDYLKIDCGFINVIGMEMIIFFVFDVVLMLVKCFNMLMVVEGVEMLE